MMKIRLLIAAAAILLLGGCAGDAFVSGPYDGPYIGGFGPYYPDGPFYDDDFVVGGVYYHNHYGGHHFFGHGFGARHFAAGHAFSGFHGGGGHR